MSAAQQQAPLKLSRRFQAPREKVFKAWTDPEELKKWWLLGHGWRLNIAEIDLRVGGRYRIGLVSRENSQVHEVSGVYKQVSAPDKLIYTWSVNDPSIGRDESVVTVEFRATGPSSTEVVLTHDRITRRESRQTTYDGWLIVLDGLARLLDHNS